MASTISRRRLLSQATVGLSSLVLANSLTSDCQAGYWIEMDSPNPNDYKQYRTNESWDQNGLFLNYRNPGGLMFGNDKFDPEWYMYFTQSKDNDSTYLNDTVPSVGVNPFVQNGFRLRASSGKGNGEMEVEFKPRVAMGGFFKNTKNRGNGSVPFTASTVTNDREAVRISLKSGEVSVLRKPNWDFPVMTFTSYAGRSVKGSVSSGNILIKLIDGNINISTRNISPFIAGATPFYLRAPGNNNKDLFISKNGKVLWDGKLYS